MAVKHGTKLWMKCGMDVAKGKPGRAAYEAVQAWLLFAEAQKPVSLFVQFTQECAYS